MVQDSRIEKLINSPFHIAYDEHCNQLERVQVMEDRENKVRTEDRVDDFLNENE
jgi:hypothetical protein